MSTTTTNLGLTLPTPNVDTGWGGTLNTDFTLVDNIFAAAGNGTSVGLNVGTGKTLVLGGTMILGTGDNTGTVTAPTIRGAAKTGTNAVGADLTIDAPNGTGTGGSGSIKFRTAPPASSGTTANTMATVLEVKPDGTVFVGGTNISAVFSTGMMMDYAGASAPTGWLLCDGAAISRTTYAALFGVISTTYGAGNGSTTFNVPDARGRATVGKDDMGGTAAGRVTSALSGIDGIVLGASGGLQDHLLTIGQMPAHQHFAASNTGSAATLSSSNYIDNSKDNGGNYSYTLGGITGAATIGLTSATGGGGAHNNMQPTIIVNKIIKT
jgi:microcystin-dependent protein